MEFFLDGEYLMTNWDHVPFYAGRLWIGSWFPNKWAGDPNFDIAEMEVDYVKFTPFENEIYECPDESYPNFGWAPGTLLENGENQVAGGDRCKSPSPVQPPVHTPTTPTPSPSVSTGNPTEVQQLYVENGCRDLPFNVCSLRAPGSYCKSWNSDECNRSICKGDDYDALTACVVDPCENDILGSWMRRPPTRVLWNYYYWESLQGLSVRSLR